MTELIRSLKRGDWRQGSLLISGIMMLLLVGAGAGAAYLGLRTQRLASQLDRAVQERQGMEALTGQLEIRSQSIQQQYDQLTTSHQQVLQDRDNILAQLMRVKSDMKDHEKLAAHQQQLQGERQLLEELLKKTAEENRALRGELPLLQDRIAEIEIQYQESTVEQERLMKQLGEAKDRSHEDELRQEVEVQKQEQKELQNLLRAMNKEVEEVERRESKVRQQLKTLEKDFTHISDENKILKHQTGKIPLDITQLAREHEKLVKESAALHYNLGVFFSKGQEYGRAVQEFSRVLELDPDDPDTHYNLGLIYTEHMPDRQKALDFFRRYLELKPEAVDASWVKEYIATWQARSAKERLE